MLIAAIGLSHVPDNGQSDDGSAKECDGDRNGTETLRQIVIQMHATKLFSELGS